MAGTLGRGILQYLEALQEVNCCTGSAAIHKAYPRLLPSRRSINRWFRRHPDLAISPMFVIECLGLLHVHLFLDSPSEELLEFPYAVSGLWLRDLRRRTLYLHCVIPREHQAAVAEWVRHQHHTATVIPSESGWQTLQLTKEANHLQTKPLLQLDARSLLRSAPLIVPVIFESWGKRTNLTQLWGAIVERNGDRVRTYLPRQRVHHVNGKSHVKQALATLERAGLFRQHAIGFGPLQSGHAELMLVLDHEEAEALLQECQVLIVAVERFGCSGQDILHIVGRWELLDHPRLISRSGVFLVDKNMSSSLRVRFAYEELFNVQTRDWQLPAAMLPWLEAEHG